MSPAMENLAAELLIHILEFACANADGATARSLLLVSRRIREVSYPFLFQTISLHASVSNLKNLIYQMQSEYEQSSGMRPKCRHLFLRFPQLAESLTTIEQWTRLMSSLLCAIAPDLETLTVSSHPDFPTPVALPCSFAVLRELCVISCGSSFSFDVTTVHNETFPSLQRLHVLSATGDSPSDFVSLVNYTPQLTHLRVSNLDHHPNLRALMKLYGKSDANLVLPNLQQVLVQPNPPRNGTCGSLYMMYLDLVMCLWCSAYAARVPVYIVPGSVKFEGGGLEALVRKAKEDWLDRIAGREGCWKVEEQWANRSDDGHVMPLHILLAKEQAAC